MVVWVNSCFLSLFQLLLFSWQECYMNKRVNKVLQQRIKPNKKDVCGWASMKLPYIVRAWAETLSRATYPITDPRIILLKQHLSFLLPLSLSLSSEDGINKPIRIQIIKHYPAPLPISCVCWQRLQITRFVYYFAWLLMVWFSCV